MQWEVLPTGWKIRESYTYLQSSWKFATEVSDDQYYMVPYFSLLESMFQFETFPRYLWIFNHGLHPCKLDVNDD